MSVYAHRWGGPRYRTEELAKFLNKHLYNVQEDQLRRGEKVNTCLAHDAFLSSKHTPLYLSSIKKVDSQLRNYLIFDELGFEGLFAEGTEILIHKDNSIQFEKIENINVGDNRVINFELVSEFSNDKLHHHLKFSENFLKIQCKDEYEAQTVLCDGLSAMTVLKNDNCIINRLHQFNSNNSQEVYLVEVTGVMELTPAEQFYDVDFLPFSYSLKKNKELSDKSKNRYYKTRQKTMSKRFLEKMRSKVFRIKKDKMHFEMDLKHDKDRN